jgi:hypothetical protein
LLVEEVVQVRCSSRWRRWSWWFRTVEFQFVARNSNIQLQLVEVEQEEQHARSLPSALGVLRKF